MDSQPAYLKGRGRGRGHTNQTQRAAQNGAPVGRGHTNQTQRATQNGAPVGRGHTNQAQRFTQNGAPVRNSQQKPGPLNPPANPWANGPSLRSPSKDSQHLETSLRSVENLFAQARQVHLESAKKYLKTSAEDDLDESEDEEEDIGSVVLNGVFKSYAKNYDPSRSQDVDSAQAKLLHSFRSGTSACLVCIETIKKDEAIWSCVGCYCMFHIPCIQKWVREGVYQKQYSSDDFNADEKTTQNIPWFCPKCRYEYTQSQCPNRYYCFCGKEQDPKFDPWLVPHSCGAVCGRRLKPDCGHSCLLLCHPGPCPPCPSMIKCACHCGKSEARMVRCSMRSWACNSVCGKSLSCGQHKCADKCHPGVCSSCAKTSIQSCSCGRSKSERPCDSIFWKCDKMCGKSLSCGNHICEQVCHSGSCGPCPRAGLRKCPCGKSEFQLPCTEDILTCGDTCGKPLECGEHFCAQRCHVGKCGQCIQRTVKRCRCGQKQKEFACAKEFLCDKKCTNLRNCGVHKCNRKCCSGDCPGCEQTCGKTLRCRNHKCASGCHKGPCYPCPLTVEINCHCKKTKISVPCGRERDTKPPRCNQPCRAPSECHHPERQKHRCHFGDCPPCSFVCNLKLEGCSHSCPAVCHDSVKTRIEDKSVKIGPWDARPARIEKLKKPCPPCVVPISIQCLGKHETSEIPCSRVKAYSCGRICGRSLECGNHVCQLECHIVTDAVDDNSAGAECHPCEHGCEAPRPVGCNHKCTKPCHPAPCPPCRMMVRMRCHCQTLLKHVECSKWVAASTKLRETLQSCEQPCPKEMACGHPCGAVCHSGPCPNAGKCEKKIVLKCKCKRKKKEIICKNMNGPKDKLTCDENCKSNKKSTDDAKQKEAKEEERRKQEAELEEFERMMKGPKRKPRKHRDEEVQEESACSKYKLHAVFLGLGLATAAAGAFFYSQEGL
ncbi:NF-x1-type Zinc finger protein nfxl1 [Plakobranchus ocellatus]|uniref:NF-x1-type Zinc finger protein nfxl1 n=1 Tax=Plakobranchus ocellatus TaxID=259542 RepID=A0AAV4DN03_9GAST|nr:NF-x1-type Zinc finger protein nfxl1 [Plakobranchus ocellatus]